MWRTVKGCGVVFAPGHKPSSDIRRCLPFSFSTFFFPNLYFSFPPDGTCHSVNWSNGHLSPLGKHGNGGSLDITLFMPALATVGIFMGVVWKETARFYMEQVECTSLRPGNWWHGKGQRKAANVDRRTAMAFRCSLKDLLRTLMGVYEFFTSSYFGMDYRGSRDLELKILFGDFTKRMNGGVLI